MEKGSILLIERLDRFSRQQTRKAYLAFVDLVEAGVTVQTLDPPQAIHEDNVDDLHVVLPLILQMTMAHEQSKEKSRRVGSVWAAKRQNARSGQPMFRKCPAWLEWSIEKSGFIARQDAIPAVEYIFARTIEGCGQRQLVSELNAQFPPLGSSGKWNSSYVQKVLSDRAVLGEFQPHSFNAKGERVPVGEPIRDYYPRVIDDAVFQASAGEKASRRKAKGPNGSFVNLFVGLLQGQDGHALHIQTTRVYGKRKRQYVQRRLVSYGHLRGLEGACPFSVKYDLVETIALRMVYEIDEGSLRPQVGAGTENRVPVAEAKVAAIQRRMDQLRAALVDTTTEALSPVELSDAIATLGEQLEVAENELAAAVEDARRPASTEQQQARDLVHSLRQMPEDERRGIRLKLRSIIARSVKTINIHLWKIKHRVIPGVEVVMRSGETRNILFDPNSGFMHECREPDVTPYIVLVRSPNSCDVVTVQLHGDSRTVRLEVPGDGGKGERSCPARSQA